MSERINRLVAQFNGAIKYTPMLSDNPQWSDDVCLEFARNWHAVAESRYRKGYAQWNAGIPYCRNVWKEPTGA